MRRRNLSQQMQTKNSLRRKRCKYRESVVKFADNTCRKARMGRVPISEKQKVLMGLIYVLKLFGCIESYVEVLVGHINVCLSVW